MFKDELEYFVAHQEELVEKYQGKVLVIKGNELLGVYDDALEAYLEAQKRYELGTFMIQACEPGPQAYSVTIGSIQSFT
ncbi:MAG: hypothetical protein WAU45_18875 [Blastocatellia bacterium]